MLKNQYGETGEHIKRVFGVNPAPIYIYFFHITYVYVLSIKKGILCAPCAPSIVFEEHMGSTSFCRKVIDAYFRGAHRIQQISMCILIAV